MPTEWAVGAEGGGEDPGQDRIYVAGEKEHEREATVRERGIPVNRTLRRDLQTIGDESGITGHETYLRSLGKS